MPYITQSDRDRLTKGAVACGPGELNYLITRLIKPYLGSNPSYATINNVIGVLECAKLELYRRIAAPHEDEKCRVNGDVY